MPLWLAFHEIWAAQRGAMLELSILGGFEVRSGRGEPIALPTRKARALLAYLTLNPDEAVSRSSLATLLWSDRGEPQANNSLSQAVSAIRKALAGVTPSPLIVEPDSLKIEGSAVAVDALAFDALSRSDNLEDLDRAESLYRGELLEGIGVRDPTFEDWLEFERRRLHALAVGALTKLLDLRRDEGQRQELVATAERLLKLDPLQEAAHRALMRCYVEQGQIGLALTQYETCAEVLKRELGVEPDGDTKRVRETIIGQRPAAPTVPITPDAPAPEHTAAPAPSAQRPLGWLLGASGLAVLAIVAGIAFWQRPWEPREEPASEANMAFPLPDKPSIAVMPFNNLSDDTSQEYFADGMTEDLIIDLSKISGLFVIARNSTFSYKGQQVKVREVAKELGVRYVLEGSVRRAGDQVRITAQLIDATTGGYVWAERYDGVMTDVFALQDEVTSKIISALAVRLTGAERLNLARMPTENLEAYDSFLRAERGLFSQNSKGLAEALSLYHRATKIDPMFARAWAGHARAAVDVWRFDWFDVMPGHVARRQAYDSAARALSLDPGSARAYSVLAILQMVDSRYYEAIESARKAVSLNPSDADAHLNLALVLSYGGEHDEAIKAMKAALRLNPKPPSGVHRLSGFILLMAQRYEQAVDLLIKARDDTPSDPSHEELAMAYAQLGRIDEAKAEIEGMLKLWPAANLTYYRVLYAHHKREEDLDFRIAALRKAGLPQWPYDYDGRTENRLKGSEIRHLVHDRIWYGSRVGADKFNRDNTKDGFVKFRDPKAHGGRSQSAYMLEGTVSVDDDKLCYRYEEFLLGRRYCGYVYQNPEGSHREANAYVDVNAIVIDYFTVGSVRRAKSDNVSGQE